MTMMVSIARVSTTENPMKLPEYQAEQKAVFGGSMTIMAILRDPNDPHQVAVVADVKDLEAMRAISRAPEGDAMMRKYGFVEQLSYFLEE